MKIQPTIYKPNTTQYTPNRAFFLFFPGTATGIMDNFTTVDSLSKYNEFINYYNYIIILNYYLQLSRITYLKFYKHLIKQ